MVIFCPGFSQRSLALGDVPEKNKWANNFGNHVPHSRPPGESKITHVKDFFRFCNVGLKKARHIP